MPATTGLSPLNDYTTYGSNAARVNGLLGLIPDPDTTSTSGAQAGNNSTTGGRGFLDEMSPAAATQLRVELNALLASLT